MPRCRWLQSMFRVMVEAVGLVSWSGGSEGVD